MLELEIPGRGPLALSRIVLDYNGTLALDGRLASGADKLLIRLSKILEIDVVTADTFGLAAAGLSGLPLRLSVLPPGRQAEAKLAFLRDLGPARCAAVGNGLNDSLMVKEAALGIAILGPEGAARETIEAADAICPSAEAALGLLLNPKRLMAPLRG